MFTGRTPLSPAVLLRLCLALAWIIVAAGCSGTGLTGEGGGDIGVQPGDGVSFSVADTAPGADTSWAQDTSGDVQKVPDTSPDPLEDAVSGDAGPATDPHGMGAPCETGEDCYSGICVEHMGDTVCTKTCEDDCPVGWSCEQVSDASGDPIFICVSSFEHLCRPCITAADCVSETSESACVDYAAEGAFCGASCEADTDCPQGFVCETMTSTRGGESKQCVDADGVCECSALAVSLGLVTVCTVSNEAGQCEGMRTCTDDGLSACDAATPLEESCNGVDDDCDGETDNVSCDDEDPCTTDGCAGADGCTHTPIAGASCDDGDPATSDDLCDAAGLCQGTPITCPEGACVVSATPNGQGCDVTYADQGAPCDDGDAATSNDQCDGAAGCTGTPYACEPTQCQVTSTVNGTDCDVTYQPLATPCDDGDVTTSDDQCDGQGGCQGTAYSCTPSQCEASSEPDGAGCVATPKALGAACDDGDPTTKVDQCDGQGGCAGTPYTCQPGPCDSASVPDGGDCVPTPKPQGDACDDGDTETKDDQCDGAGSCSGTPYTCATDQCDAAAIPNGVDCDLIYKPEGIACDDGLIETKGDQCDGQGGCAGTLYSCTATQCEASAVPNGQGCDVDYWAVGYECDDGDPTTKGDQCDGQGTCAGSPYTCELGQCDSASVPDGTGCVVTHKLEGIACDDGEPGTKGDQCDGAGGCSGSPYVCTPEQCEATSIPNGQGCDVDFWAQGTGCDDGDVTTQGDVCDGQGGCAGTPYTCTPGLCEVGAVPNGQGCDPVYAASGAACDDGLIDTLGDQCDGQGGCSGTPYACIPGPCEVTSTPDGVGCVPSYAAEGVGCDDGNAGTKDDSCDGQGGCTGIPYGCVAGPCELSSVPDGDGCAVTYEAQGVGCDDGAEDTMGDQCDGQGGCAGTPYMCQPTQCELTSVPDGSGCVPTNAPAGVLCDDDDLNTKLDVCDGFGQCAGEPYTCTASQCQVSSTADGLGCEVVLKPAGTPCDDGLPATTGDACNPLGQCVGTPTVCGDEVIEGTEVCDDGNNVTEVACPYGTPSCTACRAGCNEVLQLTGPYCGDDILQSDQGEACDDGNQIDGDGCSSTCQGEVSGCVILGVDARTLDQQPSNWQQSSCQTLCEDGGGVIPDGFRIATSEEAQFLSSVLSFGSCAACGLGSCWWYGAGNQLNASGVTSYSCTTGGCTAAAPFCYTQVLLVREGKDGTCVQ